jgi:hypothetical protein
VEFFACVIRVATANCWSTPTVEDIMVVMNETKGRLDTKDFCNLWY